jgi:putative flippase GtrA
MSRSFAKSCFVGAVVFGVDFAALGLFQSFLPQLLAVSVAYLIAVSVHYSLNKWWVFESRLAIHRAEVARYLLMVAACWFCTVAVVWLALRFLTGNIFVAKALAIPPVTILGFVLMRRFVFR